MTVYHNHSWDIVEIEYLFLQNQYTDHKKAMENYYQTTVDSTAIFISTNYCGIRYFGAELCLL